MGSQHYAARYDEIPEESLESHSANTPKPKKLIKLMLAAAKDDPVEDHEDGFGIMMIH